MAFWELFSASTIIDDLEANSKEDAFSQMLECLALAKQLARKDLPAIKRKLKEREKLGSTGIGSGVAIPHVKVQHVRSIVACLARCRQGLDFDAVDGRPVHTIFLILAPPDASEDHLRLLRWVSMLGRDEDFRRFILHARDRSEILGLLKEKSV